MDLPALASLTAGATGAVGAAMGAAALVSAGFLGAGLTGAAVGADAELGGRMSLRVLVGRLEFESAI